MIAEPNCHKRKCINFIGVKKDTPEDEPSEVVVCRAFPNGIPDVIAYGDNLHTKPFKGDNGIQFEETAKEEQL